MRSSDREIRKRVNLKKIVNLLRESGYLLPKNIENKLKIPHSTLHGYLDELYEIGVIKEYKDGWAWVDYSDDEDKIKTSYDKLKKKFFGYPPLTALSADIKDTPEETSGLLSKYIPYYRKPSEEEMAESAREIQKYLLWKCWINQKFHECNFKKWGLEKGVEKLVFSGIDGNNFSNLINKKDMLPIDKVLEYSRNFPEAAKVDEKIEGSTAHYNFMWSEDARTIFKILGGKLKPWEEKGQIPLPRKLDNNKYNKYKGSLDRSGYALDQIKDLAGFSVPDDQALEDCLDWLKNPDSKNRREVLSILRSFCMNARDCESIAPEKEEAVLETIANIAFGKEAEEILRWESLNIIKIFDGEKVKDRAKTYCLEALKKGCESENFLFEIALWLFTNPELEREIKGEVEQILIESKDGEIKKFAEKFLKSIQSLQAVGSSSLYSEEGSRVT